MVLAGELPRAASGLNGTNIDISSRLASLKSYQSQGFGLKTLSRWVHLSHSHAYFCWKATVEYLRLSPNVAGHSWWLFQDFFGISNGLVDYMFRPKNGALAPSRIQNYVHQVSSMHMLSENYVHQVSSMHTELRAPGFVHAYAL